MSKSLGNIIDPLELIEEYGAEAVRYFLARHISPFEDGDITKESFKEVYNANLANGLGNLVSRLLTLSKKYLTEAPEIPPDTIPQNFKDEIERFNIQAAADIVWQHIGALDKRIQETQVFTVLKTDPEGGKEELRKMLVSLYTIGRMLNPLMPKTNETIKRLIKENKTPDTPLFPRKE
jgi:methionyl-tRNA synthetase